MQRHDILRLHSAGGEGTGKGIDGCAQLAVAGGGARQWVDDGGLGFLLRAQVSEDGIVDGLFADIDGFARAGNRHERE